MEDKTQMKFWDELKRGRGLLDRDLEPVVLLGNVEGISRILWN